MLWQGTGVMAAPVSPADQKEILRTLTLAQHWIKQGDYSRAITYVDFEGMAEIVMAGYWDRMSQEEKNEITTFMKNLIKEKFPIITQRLKLLQFGAITEDGNQAMCETLVVFDHTTENKEEKIHIGLVKRGNDWRPSRSISSRKAFSPVLTRTRSGRYSSGVGPSRKRLTRSDWFSRNSDGLIQ